MNNHIGITEKADPTINYRWMKWVQLGKPAIIVTKMPRLLYPMISKEYNIIVHCTITGLGNTVLEPNIDTPETSLDYYHKLCKLLGKDRIVLRVDPIVYWNNFSSTVKEIVKESEGRTRISFLDLYNHTSERLTKAGVTITQKTFHKPLKERIEIWKELGKPETCSEPGLPPTPCISGIDCKILMVEPSELRKGQRYSCQCLSNKTELCLPPPRCTYGCLYCYWKDPK